jgi:hypothetical protein
MLAIAGSASVATSRAWTRAPDKRVWPEVEDLAFLRAFSWDVLTAALCSPVQGSAAHTCRTLRFRGRVLSRIGGAWGCTRHALKRNHRSVRQGVAPTFGSAHQAATDGVRIVVLGGIDGGRSGSRPRRSSHSTPSTRMSSDTDKQTVTVGFAGSELASPPGEPTAALHTVALSRLQHHPETRAYATRRTAEGKTQRDIKRCLKRAVAREIY